MELISIIFYKLLYMSIVASIIGISIVVIRKLLSKYISPKIIYAMWLVFLLALVVPPFVSSKVSVYNYIDVSSLEDLTYNYELASSNGNSSEGVKSSSEPVEEKSEDSKKSGTTSQETKPLPSLKDILPLLWLTGVGALFTIYVVSNIIFSKKIGNEKFEDDRIRKIFETSKEKFKIRSNIELINQNVVKSPAIVGIVKPKILFTEELKKNTDTELKYIFRHELAHFKRKDNVINTVLMLLRTVHWFNPIVWLVMREIKKDMEFTADEKAVKGLEIEDRKEYCKLLVNLSHNANTSFMEKAIGIANDKNNLEKRINMIKLSDKLSKHPVFSAMLVFVIIGLICLILYTNNYYQPKLEAPPKLYAQTMSGKTVEMVLVKYEWINGTEVSTYDIGFDPDTYVFKDENTLYELNYNATHYDEIIYTQPKYNISYINNIYYSKNGAGSDKLDHYVVRKDFYPNINAAKIEDAFIGDGITQLDVYFPNGSTASYVVQKKEYTGGTKEFFEKYSNIAISDIDKIKELVKTMQMGDLVKDIKVENNVLNINYEYMQDQPYSYNMSTILFVAIPDLEKIVISANHDKVFYTVDSVSYDVSNILEITREEANKRSNITIEDLQKIIKES